MVFRSCELCGLLFEDDVGEVFGEDLFGEAEDDGVLDGVLEFADVAGPAIAHEQGTCVGGDAFEGAFVFLRVLRGEVEGEERNVFGVLTQGRHGDGDNVEAVVEVLAKFVGLDGLLEIFVGCGEDASEEGDRTGSSYTFELSLLEDAEEFGLHGGSEFAYLVEEEGSVFGGFELSFSHADGSGVCTFFVAEEFAFEEGFGDGGAVDGDEWAIASWAALMDGACDDLFAGAALAADEDGGSGRSDARDELADLTNLAAFADEVAGGVELFF